MDAYYNEIDPFAAAWLRELIADGLIAPGDVDERSIEDVEPSDLAGYTQCHFFAGIGGWSLALRHAGWPDDRPVWTGSCPCQPFSSAGKGDGVTDERHLWPAFHHLIRVCKPDIVFGEQVAAAVRYGWLDLVQADLEGEGYAFGAAVLGAHSVGAPHIRQRLWWVAHALPAGRAKRRTITRNGQTAGGGELSELADSSSKGLEGRPRAERAFELPARESGLDGELAYADQQGSSRWRVQRPRESTQESVGAAQQRSEGLREDCYCKLGVSDCDGRESWSETPATARYRDSIDPTSWVDCDWILCRDGKWRPVESGTFPLAHGIPARVGRLRGYGNAVVPQVAAEFIRAYMAQGEGQRHPCEHKTDLGRNLCRIRQAYIALGGKTLATEELDEEL